jgi:hypothetical protein
VHQKFAASAAAERERRDAAHAALKALGDETRFDNIDN